MADFTASAAVDFTTLDVSDIDKTKTLGSPTATTVTYQANGITDTITGDSFAFDLDNTPLSGNVTSWSRAGVFTINNIDSVSLDDLYAAAGTSNTAALSLVFAGDDSFTGSTATDHLIGYGGADDMDGGEANDTLEGDVGNDTLTGGAGNDSLIGGTGDDLYVVDTNDSISEAGGDGTDEVQSAGTFSIAAFDGVENLTLTGGAVANGTGNAEKNVITGNSAANDLAGGDEDDTLVGGGGADELLGEGGNDSLVGEAGNDSLSGGIGTDKLDGGDDADSLDGGADADTLIGGAAADTLLGQAGLDSLEGDAGADDLDGGTEADTLSGGTENDTLDGGAAKDSMLGGDGDDTYIVDVSNDVVDESAGTGTDTVLAGADFTLGTNVENLTLSGTATLGGGNGGNNQIIGNTTGSSLSGAAGDDTLIGNANNDTLLGGNDEDSLTANGGADSLDGGLGADTMAGGTGADTYIVDNTGDTVTETGADIDLIKSSVSIAALATGVENLTLTGTAISGTGNTLANVITGNASANTLDGAAGADTLSGGGGNDTYIVDNIGDQVSETGGSGTDTVQSSVNFTLGTDIENLTLTGTAASGTGNELDNVITGNASANTLDGAAGADSLSGGGGNDTYIVDNLGDDVSEAGGSGTDTVLSSVDFTLGTDIENLTLTGTAISGTGNTLGNIITGIASANTLDGSSGADSLLGGDGDDTYIVDDLGDQVTEAAGKGTDTVQSSVNFTLGADIENLTLTGTAASGTGNGLNNIITGNASANTLDGAVGADSLSGGGGNDTYIVDNLGDQVSEAGGSGTDLVQSSVNFTLGTDLENLTLTGTALTGTGNALGNIINGNANGNTLDGAGGADSLFGGDGNDLYIVDNLGDQVTEAAGKGTDTVKSSVNFTLGADIENLTLTGGGAIDGTGNVTANSIVGNSGINNLSGLVGNDTLDGGDGNDTLLGGVDNDSLTGGIGNDSLDGGAGADTMAGDNGDDIYAVDNASDDVNESGTGVDEVRASISYNLAAAGTVENLTLTGTAISGTGNTLDNIITGNDIANTLDGGTGADSLLGGDGDDTYIVDNIGDKVTESAGKGTDTVKSSVNFILGAEVENLTLTGTAISGTGNGLDNIITGNAGANTLDGAAGADSLSGGGGNDTYVVDNAGDDVSEAGGSGTDTVQSSVNFTLGDDIENLTLTGTAISGTGNELGNVITGNAVGNTLDGATGADSLSGGDGNDTYIVDNLGDKVTELTGKGIDTVKSSVNFILGADIENLTLTGTAISGTGNELANIITGNASANTLDGAAGADSLLGGDGDDTYLVDDAGDKVTELAGKGLDTVQSSISFTLGAELENLTLTGTAISGTGNTLDNIITGNAVGNTLDGAAGADSLSGGDGDDTYIVDDAGDKVTELSGKGADTVQSSINFTLGAELENLTLTGAAISGTGNTLGNIINGNANGNTLDGAGGADSLFGGDGNDTYIVDNLGDQVTELAGKGTDTVQSAVNFTLGADIENLTLTGTAISGTGNTLGNIINGNASANTLDGAAGADSLSGGDGNDTYIVDNLGDQVTEAIGKGTDTVQSSVNFTLGADVENLTLTGTAISGTGNAGINTIIGNASANTLDGAAGADNLIGGDGDDTYIVDDLGDDVTELAGKGLDTVKSGVNFILGTDVENLTLTGTATTGTGNTLGNVITGNAIGNTLDGAAGADSLLGGDGDDTYIVDDLGDKVTELAANGSDTVKSSVDFILGAELENLTLTGTAISGTGNALGNIITGNASANTLDGAAGADSLTGGEGNDTYIVDSTSDLVTEAGIGDIDEIQTTTNLGGLAANIENLTLLTGATIGIGNGLGNKITGNAVANTLDGGVGADSLVGGDGNDTYVVDDAGDQVAEAAGKGTDTVKSAVNFILGAELENLTLTDAAVSGTGNILANVITGNAVGNTLDGAAGADSLLGGDGNDTYIVDDIGDKVTEVAANGIDTVKSSVNFILDAELENLTLTGTAISGTGNALGNIIIGNASANTLDGAAGADSLTGGEGNDTYIIDSISDVVTETGVGDIDEIQTTTNLADLDANIENLTLLTGATIGIGNTLANIITGNAVANTLDGGAGADSLSGGGGNDTYIVDDLGDKITELAANGTDTVQSAVNFVLGAELENLTLTGAAVSGTGNTLANIITGNAVGNTLDGAAGADSLLGGDGDDTYVVDDLGDKVTELATNGTDTVKSAVNFVLGAELENLTLTGTAATGTGNILANIITGNASANTLDGAAGADSLLGGDGNDSYIVDDLDDLVTELAGKGTDTVQSGVNFTLGAELENLTLTGTAITGTGNILANIISGNASANTLDGAAGADSLLGGDGNDTYIVDDLGDKVTELAANGTDIVKSGVSFTLGAEIENLTLTGAAASGIGNTLGNIIIGNAAANTLDGAGGADSLSGGDGNDTYFVDSTSDVTTEESGKGTDLVQTTVSLTLAAEIENLTLIGTAVSGTGNLLGNIITGNASANTLDGAVGADSLSGGDGNDTYIVDDLADLVTELAGKGTDTVQSGVNFTLGSELENLTLTGTAGIGTGNALANFINGNAGNNTLNGLGGNDTMAGGNGDDRYIIDSFNDVVSELVGGGNDTVEAADSFKLGINIENLILTGTAISGTGSVDANQIFGNSANNILSGLGGADTLFGGAGLGLDTLQGGDSNDLIFGEGGADSLLGEAGDDTLEGGDGADILAGGIGNNLLKGGDGDDTYIINAVDDVIEEGVGKGIDTVLLEDVSFSLLTKDNVEIENLTITGNSNINATGNDRANKITGNAGNNELRGGNGNDTLIGGKGDDIYFIEDTKDTGKDQVIELAGEGSDTIQSAVSISLVGFSEIENIQLVQNGNINAVGSDTDNKITGNNGNNSLSGGNGNDTLLGDGIGGDSFADTLNGGAGNDTYFVEGNTDIVVDSGGIDTVFSTKSLTLAKGIEIGIVTGTGNMELIGTSGNDTLTSTEDGNDTLNGLAGADSMTGGNGDDTYFVDNIKDVILELSGEGNDTVKSTIAYTLGDNLENLELLGAAGISGTGNDLDNSITGNNGANRLDGREGDDKMSGGLGSDTYVVDSSTDQINGELFGLAGGNDTVETIVDYDLTGAVGIENLVLLNTGVNKDIDGIGNTFNNKIVGNDGNNLIVGDVGNDTLTGGAGNDTLIGGVGVDVMTGGAGSDVYEIDKIVAFDKIVEGVGAPGERDTVRVTATASGYVLGANLEDIELADDGPIKVMGNALGNKITASDENSTLNGGAGVDTLIGGSGDNIYVIDRVEEYDVLSEVELGVDNDEIWTPFNVSLSGTLANIENVHFLGTGNVNAVGSNFDNRFFGNFGNNLIEGLAGDDILFGNVGADTLIGGLGDDRLHFDNLKDVLDEQVGEGDDTVEATLSVDLRLDRFKNIENIDITGGAALFAIGNDFANEILGNFGSNKLDGLKGNDSIHGFNGNDTINGGEGADTMEGGANNDTFMVDNVGDIVTDSEGGVDSVISEVSFTLSANVENLTLLEFVGAVVGKGSNVNNIILGNSNANELFGFAGNDTLTGNAGKDTLDGGTGIDNLAGGLDDDLYIVDDSKDKIAEAAGGGFDTVKSSATYVLPANVEALILTGTDKDDINGTGNGIANKIVGNDGDNILNGVFNGVNGPGDTMEGGLGDDTYVVNSLKDQVTEAANGGSDTLQTPFVNIDLATDPFLVNFEHVTLTGKLALNATGDDDGNKLIGNAAANRLEGGLGADTLDGGGGIDVMVGGIGNDVYVVDNIKDEIVEGIGEGTDTVSSFVTYTLAPNFENLTLLGKANINATGSDGINNVMIGNDGNNRIDGLSGNDTMSGGKGNDTFIVQVVGDKVVENADEGTDSVISEVSFVLGDNIENLTLVELSLAVNGTGGGTSNIIIGNSADNELLGLAGKDQLIGNAGDDKLDGGDGSDTMVGGLGNDIYFIDNIGDKVSETGIGTDLVQSKVTHTLGANFENLTLINDGNLETAENGFGNSIGNIIVGNDEANKIDGFGGADTMAGGDGDDIYFINITADKIIEEDDPGSGKDTVFSAISIDSLWENVENVFLFGNGNIHVNGNKSDNNFSGNFGANDLSGAAGKDTLNGGGGNDTLTGGADQDTFVRANQNAQGVDVITDFDVTPATGDILDISAILIGFKDGESELDDFVRAVKSANGLDTLIQVDRNGGENSFATVFVLQGVLIETADLLPHIDATVPTNP